MRDQELQELVDKAAAQRADHAEREDRQREQAARRRRPLPPPSPVRFMVYKRMHDGGLSHLWFLPLSIFVGLAMFVGSRWFQLALLVYAVAFAIRLGIYSVGLLRGYARFKRFPANLRVKLEGWDSLLDDKLLADPEQWQHSVTLAVELVAGADRLPVEAALDLFLPQANDSIYDSSLTSWTRDGHRVTGSLNVWVLGALYRLIHRLDWVHRRSGGISLIAVSKRGDIGRYWRPSGD